MSIIIADGFNTSYIDSLIVGLFYKTTHINNMLNQIPKNIMYMYLQDLIKINIIENIKNNFSVDSCVANEIRNYSYLCGWKNGLNYNITDLHNVVDYFDFLVSGFDYSKISFELMEIIKNDTNIHENIKHIDVNYIQMNVCDDSDVKLLIEKWIDSILLTSNESSNESTIATIAYYHFKELPILIPIYLHRFSVDNQFNNCMIDIKKRIKFYKNNDKSQLSASWILHSIICYSTIGRGKYYTIFNDEQNWYLFSDDKIPSIIKIDIKDDIIGKKIKQECVLILYKLDESHIKKAA